ncbi:MarR family transcriptional regulator [Saprospiraceae bacterium]|jgi:DNA-binding MarR family transcriptional regulator|nr:MarR family transcriptional regulator [Bacteroidota bacterium]MDB4728251.1 MarR family transcriptional regulator [Saprospiraceae bacterium]MDF1865478.1 MarR family transcriptional regulator [Saprospiraceae bacterium]
MTIEEAIKQKKPFRNQHQRAVVNLIFTTNQIREKIKKALKPFGITLQQYNVLRILRGAGEPITTSVIRERLLDKMADTSRMVDRLFQKGLVNRAVCPSDKRLVDVSLSDKGFELLEQMNNINQELDTIISEISSDEAALLNNLLDKIRG